MRPKLVSWAVLVVLIGLAGCDSTPPPLPPAASGVPLVWKALAPSPSARTEVAAAASGTQIVVAGGYRADGGTVATVEIFDTFAGTWKAGPDLPVPVNHAMAATVSGTVYVFGGYDSHNQSFDGAFRLTGNGWQSIATMPEPRAAGAAVAADGRIYVAGGIGKAGALASTMLVYDTATGQWLTEPGPPTPREHLGAAAFGGEVYTVGGRTGAGNLAAFEVFSPGTRKWSQKPDLPTPRGGMAAAATCSGGIVAVGGEAQATFAEAELFDIKSGVWQALPPLPTPRHGLGAVTVGTVLYTLAGGKQPGLHVADTTEAIDLAALGNC